MDIQMKRGLLDACVLASIRSAPSYGYQIIKDLKPYVAISESTLYPILRRLETAKLLTVRAAEHNGRLRKYYHITPQGLQRLESFKKDPAKIVTDLLGIKLDGDVLQAVIKAVQGKLNLDDVAKNAGGFLAKLKSFFTGGKK